MPHVVVLATGGTIASRGAAAGAAGAAPGAVATDTAADLLAGFGPVAAGLTVEAVDVMRKNSFNLVLGDLREMVLAIAGQLGRGGVDGVVVTHGTDTLEESAFLADLVHRDSRPVVFTGAQLAADQPDSDGPRNLRDAVLVAAGDSSRGRGVLVVFAGEILAVRGLSKADSLAAQPFRVNGAGPIGQVAGGRVRFTAHPDRAGTFELPGTGFGDVRVEIVPAYPGADGAQLRAAVDGGARGVVVTGTGTGNPGSALVAEIERAVRGGVVVALGSRTASGPVQPVYAGGGAVDAVAAGAVPLGYLPAAQARILLALLLSRSDADSAAVDLAAFVASP